MTRRFDTFPFNDEFDMLECRLVELYDHVDHFVAVEADVTHGHNRPKPYRLTEALEHGWFPDFADKLHVVRATDLPDALDAWSREHAQREWIGHGLRELGAEPDDIVFQSDVDEIPRTEFVDHVNPAGFVAADMDLYCWTLNWLHPQRWRGTVAARLRNVDRWAAMRDARLFTPTVIPDAGWHLSWLGGRDAQLRKINSFCHPEVEDFGRPRIQSGHFMQAGQHIDGHHLTWVAEPEMPRWIAEGNAPDSWWGAPVADPDEEC